MTLHRVVLAVAIAAMGIPQPILAAQTGAGKASSGMVHVSNSFDFEVRAAMVRVTPLFGPAGERAWAGQHWNPEFLYPTSGEDIEGAVFTVQHGPHTSVWVNTVFDLPGGRMQYVSMISEVVVSVVSVRVTKIDAGHTSVRVTYDRTALAAAASDDVRAMGESDRENGPKWRDAIEECLGLPHR